VENPPGLYIFYVRDNIVPPADFPTSRKRRLQQEAQQAKHGNSYGALDLLCLAEAAREASAKLRDLSKGRTQNRG
jgi:hypothetical protein